LPFVAASVSVFGVNIIYTVNQASIDSFKVVRLLANVFDLIDANVWTTK